MLRSSTDYFFVWQQKVGSQGLRNGIGTRLLAHISTMKLKKVVKAKKFKSIVCGCKFYCNTTESEAHQQSLFYKYRAIEHWGEQQNFLAGLLTKHNVKWRTTTDPKVARTRFIAYHLQKEGHWELICVTCATYCAIMMKMCHCGPLCHTWQRCSYCSNNIWWTCSDSSNNMTHLRGEGRAPSWEAVLEHPYQCWLRQQSTRAMLCWWKIHNVITTDESWAYMYDLTTKQQSKRWLKRGTSGMLKQKSQKSMFEVMIITFFDKKCMIYTHTVSAKTKDNE